MKPGDVFVLIIISIAAALIVYMANLFFAFRKRQLDVDARLAAEKAAQYAVSNAELEQRVRVLEQIVTDGGAQTAAQIEALRDPPRGGNRKPVSAGDAAA